jgi:tetratricopeptide (TPR) repeat protein
MVIGGISLVLYAYRVYWALLLIAIGVGVFLFVLFHHPSRFYRGVVWASIGLLASIVGIPAIHFSGLFGQVAAVELVIESVGTGGLVALCLLCCIALGVSARMDYIRERAHRDVDPPIADENPGTLIHPQIGDQHVCAPSNSPVIAQADTVHITYVQGESSVKKEPVVCPEDKTTGSWPGVSLPQGGPKISEPFAGREDELGELGNAMAGQKKIVAVVGLAGQGKSCLIGEWYKRGAHPPDGIGLFWRKVYEAGYTFDRFLDDLHLCLAGEPINRMEIRTTRERAAVVEGMLTAKPCWIVLDGMERWLRRWASDPDAQAKDATADDRAGYDPALDGFLKDAHFRENGSRLLLTTRAVPSALDEHLPVMIGDKHGRDPCLRDLKVEDAIALLDELDVKGTDDAKRQAVTAYGCHAYAVHVLGVLIRDLYGGDASHWHEVNPLKEPGLSGLFERIIERCQEDVPLLNFIACSLGPAPVEMLVELTSRDETSVRKSLARLTKWQMVEFEGSDAEQHTIVRQFLLGRMDAGGARACRKQMALWWTRRMVTMNPKTVKEILPLLRAIEHLVAAKDLRVATNILFTQFLGSHYNVDDWLHAFGYLDDEIHVNASIIEACADLIQNEGRRELRDDLASCCNSRGNALRVQGHLSEAIADHDRAIEITIDLVEKEGRCELRSDLARRYNNRATVLLTQGLHSKAITDYERAIEIAEGLVEREGNKEPRSDLAGYYGNRGIALAAQGHLSDAIADYARAIVIVENLVKQEDRRDLHSEMGILHNNRGLALAAQGRLSEAIMDYGRAIEVAEGLVEREGRSELRHMLATYHDNRGNALARQGHLCKALADHDCAIEIHERLVEQEGRYELRDPLARFYSNRGIVLADQDHLAEAIADYDHAIAIREGLVKCEPQGDLRNSLAVCYNNRGSALATQGLLEEAITDYGRAIEIREELVIREGRRDLRDDLAVSYIGRSGVLSRQKHPTEAVADCNRAIEIERTLVEQEGRRDMSARWASALISRAVARSRTGDWLQVGTDIEKGAALLQMLVEEGQCHVLSELLKVVSFRCRYAKELGDLPKAAQGANDAMQWFLEEIEQNRTTEPLLKAAAGFADDVRGNQNILLKHGLDELLWQRFQSSLGPLEAGS